MESANAQAGGSHSTWCQLPWMLQILNQESRLRRWGFRSEARWTTGFPKAGKWSASMPALFHHPQAALALRLPGHAPILTEDPDLW